MRRSGTILVCSNISKFCECLSFSTRSLIKPIVQRRLSTASTDIRPSSSFYNSARAIALLSAYLRGSPFGIYKVPGAGRGLVATQAIPQGAVIFSEKPLLSHPSFERENDVCYHCMKVLEGPGRVYSKGSRPRPFCGPVCLEHANESYFTLENAAESYLRPFVESCHEHKERFPLLAKRLAFMHCTEAVRDTLLENARTNASRNDDDVNNSVSGATANPGNTVAVHDGGSVGNRAGSTIPNAAASGVLEGRAISDVGLLCFANVALPLPEPWVEQHHLIRKAIAAAADEGAFDEACAAIAVSLFPPNTLPTSSSSSSSPPSSLLDSSEHAIAAARLMPQLMQSPLDAAWFASILARLHLNVFRVDAVFMPDWGQDAQKALSAMILGAAGPGSSGSAAYLLGSFLNHSCEPNVEVSFRENDATATFSAARDVEAGEELRISYVDAEAGLQSRQEHLAWGYGFECRCPKCVEQLSDASTAASPVSPPEAGRP